VGSVTLEQGSEIFCVVICSIIEDRDHLTRALAMAEKQSHEGFERRRVKQGCDHGNESSGSDVDRSE